MIEEAFFQVCDTAKPARGSYVSLYVSVPYYGGPEEGGWWGHDDKLIAYRLCRTEEEADAVVAKVKELAETLTKQAKDDYGRACLAQCEWLDARGLDSDFLPEVDGEDTYWVTTEETPGQYQRTGSRHYE